MKMKSTKSFRFLALILSLCLLSGITPVISLADNPPSIAITSHSNGDVLDCGENVILKADWNMADVSRIDFYANGDKLPGFITSPSDSFIWQSPVSGAYSVKAVATYVSGATPEESAPVEIYVKPEGIISEMTADSIANRWRYGWATGKFNESAIVNKYGALEGKSLQVVPAVKPCVVWNEDITLKATDYINTLVYVEGIPESYDSSTPPNVVISAMIGTNNKLYKAPSVTLKNGWNTVSRCIGEAAVADYLMLYFNNYATYKDTIKMYVNGFYLSDAPITAEGFAASPVIADEKTGVCNELTKYRIKFTRPLANCLVADSAGITVSGVSGTSATAGTDYIDVNIPASSLACNTTYTVTIPANTVIDCYGNAFAGASFTFTTIENTCNGADPIPEITFPKNNSSISSKSKLTAKVIFSGNVDYVEFIDTASGADVVIGSSAEGFKGEYSIDASSLADGEHTIKVKAVEKDGTGFESPSVSFTSITTNYRLVGIENNDDVIINEKMCTQVRVIDDNGQSENPSTSTATNVAKVVYYVNGVQAAEVNEAPYAFTLPFGKLGTNTLKAVVYDTGILLNRQR